MATGFFDEVASAARPPEVKLESGKTTRIRVIPGPEGTKYCKGEPQQVHRVPKEQEVITGGFCSILCVGSRNGCIFHDEPYKWPTSKRTPINVIEYELDSTGRFTGNRFVKLWIFGPRVGEQIATMVSQKRMSVGGALIDPCNYDIFLSRSGNDLQTVWNVNWAPDVLEAQINWNFPPIALDFRDDTYPFLIDWQKVYGFQPMSPSEQTGWLADMIQRGQEKIIQASASPAHSASPAYSVSSPPQASFGGSPGNAQFIPGALPNFAAIMHATSLPSLGGTSPTMSHPGFPPPVLSAPGTSAPPDPCSVMSPWGNGMIAQLPIEHIQHIANGPLAAPGVAGFTPEQIAAAKSALRQASPPAPLPPPPPSTFATAPPPALPAPSLSTAPPLAAAPFPKAASPFPTASPLPPIPVRANPLVAEVEAKLQTVPLFINFSNVRKILKFWNITTFHDASEPILRQVLEMLGAPLPAIEEWVNALPAAT